MSAKKQLGQHYHRHAF